MEFKCPTCGKAIPSATTSPNGKKQMNASFFPFCSQRCRLVDLGAWLDGDYRISVSESQLEEESFSDE